MLCSFLVALAFLVAPQRSRWEAPPSCPSRAEVDAMIRDWGLSAEQSTPPWQARIEQRENTLRLTLTVQGEQRIVEDPSCTRLAQAGALIVAVAGDPLAVVQAVSEPRPAEPPLASRPPIEPPQYPEPAAIEHPIRTRSPAPMTAPPPDPIRPAAPSSARVRGRSSIAGGAELGVLPRAGFGLAIATGASGPWWRAEALGSASLPRRQFLQGDRTRGARAMVFGAGIRGCLVAGRARVRAPLCAALEAGGLWARGFGPDLAPRSRTQPWLAAVPSTGIEVMLSQRWGLAASVGVPIAINNPAVHLDGFGGVFRTGSVGARVWLGPTLYFL